MSDSQIRGNPGDHIRIVNLELLSCGCFYYPDFIPSRLKHAPNHHMCICLVQRLFIL